MSIQRFIESSPTNRAPVASARTCRCRSGWMLPRKSISDAHASSPSFGTKSAKTLSWVSSVWATFMSWS